MVRSGLRRSRESNSVDGAVLILRYPGPTGSYESSFERPTFDLQVSVVEFLEEND